MLSYVIISVYISTGNTDEPLPLLCGYIIGNFAASHGCRDGGGHVRYVKNDVDQISANLALLSSMGVDRRCESPGEHAEVHVKQLFPGGVLERYEFLFFLLFLASIVHLSLLSSSFLSSVLV